MKKLVLLLLITVFPYVSFSQSQGTGFAINSNGYIATNFHVVEGQNKITVKGIKGEFTKSYTARVVKLDKANDLAILKVETNLGMIPYGFKNKKEDVASMVFAYGYPIIDLLGNEVKFTEGRISSNSGLMNDPRWYQHTATIQSGNSGGPLFNKYGNLVGINNAGIDNDKVKAITGSETTNINYAIKTRYLLNLMEDLDLQTGSNIGINKLDIEEQYKKVKKFVYIIFGDSEETNRSTKNKKISTTIDIDSYPIQKADGWYTDIDEASKVSRITGKPLLLFFTGSDWCGWCKKLVREVYAKPEFKKWAEKNVILVEIDFPRRSKLSDQIQKQNRDLQQMFGVRGYPTIWFVNPVKTDKGQVNLSQLGSTGYVAGGPTKWIADANKILNSK
ncbi:MAG: hypothetical protein CMD22_01680 [Flavobacteriales bacterium]|nr:hypothetical protein [Flavobacteriales bacterium]|tara:strand:- start:2338 stop:3507 length:1170 start_codon:yes stop_codon:yes gene_type:complete